jgi:hypothetical protein
MAAIGCRTCDVGISSTSTLCRVRNDTLLDHQPVDTTRARESRVSVPAFSPRRQLAADERQTLLPWHRNELHNAQRYARESADVCSVARIRRRKSASCCVSETTAIGVAVFASSRWTAAPAGTLRRLFIGQEAVVLSLDNPVAFTNTFSSPTRSSTAMRPRVLPNQPLLLQL